MADTPTTTDAAKPILDSLSVDNSIKHDAWEAFHNSQSPEQFRSFFDKAAMPQEAKRALWDAKFGSPAASTPTSVPNAPGGTPPVVAPVLPTPKYTPERKWEMALASGLGLNPEELAQVEAKKPPPAKNYAEEIRNMLTSGESGAAVNVAKQTAKNLLQGGIEFLKQFKNDPLKAITMPFESPVTAGEKAIQEKDHGTAAAKLVGIAAGVFGSAALPELETKFPEQAAIKVAGKEVELPATSGMATGTPGVRGLESIAGRSALFGGPLRKVYANANEVAGKSVADILRDTTGADTPTFAAAAKEFKTRAKEAYAPVDAYLKDNVSNTLDTMLKDRDFAMKALSGDKNTLALMNAATSENSISSLKEVRDAVAKKAIALDKGGQGTAAFQMYQQAAKIDDDIKSMVGMLPPELQKNYQRAEQVYGQYKAMQDTGEIFAKATSPSGSVLGIGEQPSLISGKFLSDAYNRNTQASVRNQSRLTQAVGPENAESMRQLATYLTSAQQNGTLAGRLVDIATVGAAVSGNESRTLKLAMGLGGVAKVLSYPSGSSIVSAVLQAPVNSARYQFGIALMGKMINDQDKQQPAPAAPQPQQAPPSSQPIAGGATLGQQLQSKGIPLPMAQPNQPGLPFHPGTGLNQ